MRSRVHRLIRGGLQQRRDTSPAQGLAKARRSNQKGFRGWARARRRPPTAAATKHLQVVANHCFVILPDSHFEFLAALLPSEGARSN